jgi:hypothetical protein
LVELFRKILGDLNAILSKINEWQIHLLAFLVNTINDYFCLPSLPLVETGRVLFTVRSSRVDVRSSRFSVFSQQLVGSSSGS